MPELPTSVPPHSPRLPNQRWQIYSPQPQQAEQFANEIGLSCLLAQVLINRGIDSLEEVQGFIEPESLVLPAPLDEFPDLAASVKLLREAISTGQKIAICGDYDADGMTSTALLLRALRALGANVDYAIPSRMHEGYGINDRIVEEFHAEGVALILTVDNGIAAYGPVARARELGVKVIITDHHDLPPKLPPADAILNPKLIAESSPYRGLAGVGVAYVLAITLAQDLKKVGGLVNPLLELFTLGTIADLAPLTGVNRRWVKRGLRLLPHSQLAGVQALIQVAGVQPASAENLPLFNSKTQANNTLKPEDIGFRLGPRINAVGRLADPQIVIELLTTDDRELALKNAMQCEQINQRRQELCQEIEQEAIAWCEKSALNLQQERVLVVVQPGWHHGVIGIVASRLLERYGVPVFIGTFEDEGGETGNIIRGSARGIPEFNVFDGLNFCADLLTKFGGHKAAGGFSMPAKNLEQFRKQLSIFANQCLQPEHLKPLVSVDVRADLAEINLDLYRQIDALEPCGIENKAPVFWTPNVCITEQKIVGKGGHVKLTATQDEKGSASLKGIAWRWGEYFPLPRRVDIAYRLRENSFNGKTSVELELLGVRLVASAASSRPSVFGKVEFDYCDRTYSCSLSPAGSQEELRIRNSQGQVLVVEPGQSMGLLGNSRQDAREVDVSLPFFENLIQTAKHALGI
ncbi:MAG: single-stranded-DNA-specific exonuclease RecJ [Microcoleus sp. PH2017_29_MFU_D_A]|uniref:single-stranded-DNA-specific exonuclease RecJ n=1 Tax=unclassified Microcoleus TaxID=2642155 RepID=UPI001E00D659|nr:MULTISPECIES: single-stranded-DNA-specific exonuclease RecJ [unclassified Microcoleus]MCC3432716.1 single-stranded-DNA-specific exonuclease RecJ [Microcoleus sp. PH2017_04_SCI_O_A]MCC3443347.1 single-stranded-DNA-specific exonuclease RecJ [Microcoleus sp. PH2017_03_ELD_O_A]MCC3465809.1 single-stranded-DNA-specific exonuclease RecJ [Microcoleus sp. PH2017_06_SFM_O_A]MCC3502530.1 single-stranded-DNA-specific exonuclease RecJ [Microcoleus sp. PH2017_19_SFW_U_A]TAE12441.1 MAG: single-stranded-D